MGAVLPGMALVWAPFAMVYAPLYGLVLIGNAMRKAA